MQRLLDALPKLEVVHQTGARHGDSTMEAYRRAGGPDARVTVTPYLDDMAGQFAAADLIVCRSGASTMAELAAAGKASVLVPFPQAADDHQRKNADVFVSAGAAEMVVEAELNEERLLDVLSGLLKDDAGRKTMGERARGLAHPEAVREIGKMVMELARR
jgi:UDP-N-acetylglucosamine--N-acetylmuramyl-(pentapeptide) pyrophosphoryl-undecaprenol N-acetylglucosamine transferase